MSRLVQKKERERMNSTTIIAIAILAIVGIGPSLMFGVGTYALAAVGSVFVPLIGWKKLCVIHLGLTGVVFINPQIWGYIDFLPSFIHTSWIVAGILLFAGTYLSVLYVTFECYHYLKRHHYISQHCYGV